MDQTNPTNQPSLIDHPPAYPTEQQQQQQSPKNNDRKPTSTTTTKVPGSKPIIITLRLRTPKTASFFTVPNLGQIVVAKEQKDVLLLHPTITLDETCALLLQRAEKRGFIPPAVDENPTTTLLQLISISANRISAFVYDVVELDEESWEAGRELLFTKEDAILRLDVALMVEGGAGTEKMGGNAPARREEGEKCVVQ